MIICHATKEDMQENKKKAEDFNKLISMVKEKVKLSRNRREKLQLLTWVLDFWSREKISAVFNATFYSVI